MNTQLNKQTGSRGIEWTDFTFNVTAGCKHACRWMTVSISRNGDRMINRFGDFELLNVS